MHVHAPVHVHALVHVHLPTQGSNAFESRHGGTPLLKNAIVDQIVSATASTSDRITFF